MRFFSCCLFLLLLGCGLAHADEESLKVNSHGIKVWTYPIPNYPLRGFRATTVVKSTLGGLVSLIQDTDNVSDWVYHVNRIDMIKRDDTQQSFVIHAEVGFWPLKDRDAYIQGRVTQDPKSLVVSIDSSNTPAGAYPLDKHFVRMPDMQGHWELRPLGQGMVQVTMSGRADPGGDIPDFLVNLVVQENPYNTLLGLQRVIVQDKYQRSVLRQIHEPAQ